MDLENNPAWRQSEANASEGGGVLPPARRFQWAKVAKLKAK